MISTLCEFGVDGTCAKCGYVAKAANTFRECRVVQSRGEMSFASVPQPTLADLHVIDQAPVSGNVEDYLPAGNQAQPMPSRESPGFLTKLRNFATAAAGHVAAGMPMASDEEIIRRHDICLACEHLVDNACTQCGCPVARVRGYVSKLSWADQECPIGKWGKVEPPPAAQ